MPRETIRRLSRDIERILVAGAHLAPADPELARDRKALDDLARQLGSKATVIGQLAAAAARTSSASGKDAARELVSLATICAQIRAAQATAAPVPVHEALQPTPRIGTPCKSRDLGDLYDALVTRGKGRQEKVKEFAERGDLVDLRLVDALIHAMGDPGIGDVVTNDAIPRLGPAIVAPIRARLDLARGLAVDGRRLRALVAVEKSGARDLLTSALNEGNAEMREAAFDAVADHVRGEPELEPLILAAVQKERAGGVKRAALRALAGYSSDASLDALIEALGDGRTLDAAAEGLGASRNPRAVDWMLDRIVEVVKAPRLPKQGSKSGPKEKPGSVEPKALVAALLRALAQQKDPRIADLAMGLVDDYGMVAAAAVLESGNREQLARIADFLTGQESNLFTEAARAAVLLGPDEVHRRFTAAFLAKDRESKVGQARLAAVAARLRGTTERRWGDFLLRMLREPHAVALHAMPLLGFLKDRRATGPLVKILQAEKSPAVVAAAIRAAGAIGDPAAVDAILAHAGRGDWQVQWALREALLAIDDASSVEKVRASYAGVKNPEQQWHLRSLLELLQKRFPGK